MDEKINYTDIPKTFLYCNHKQCPRRNKCLRYQATLCIPQNVPYYTTVNPLHMIGNENKCDFFKPFCTVQFASGIDHLLDKLPHATAVAIHREMYSLMGRNMYYRIRNKECLLHPSEQEQIVAIFLKHGIKDKPQFDQYINKYDW